MIRRDTDVRTSLPCPVCDRRLIPVPADSSVTFHCKTGHEFRLSDLLQAGSDSVRISLQDLLEEWQREQESLVEMASHAQRDRLQGIAELFRRHAERLEARIRTLRQELAHLETDPAILMPESPYAR